MIYINELMCESSFLIHKEDSGKTFVRSKYQNFQNLKVDLKVALLFFVDIDCVEDLSSFDS